VRVVNIVPDGVEPHDYEPTAEDLRQLSDAALVISIGEGFDEQLTASVPKEKLLTFMEQVEAVRAEEEGEEHGHEHAGIDPHVWLDTENAASMVLAMGTTMSAFAPLAEVNAANYAQELARLDERFANSLASCQTRNIIVAHDAFGYLAGRYQLTAHPIMGLSPEGEPDANTLARLADEANELGVNTIFVESLASQKAAQVIASEVGAEIAVLDPLEGITPKARRAGATYLGIMEQNRQALHTALRCL
jgi:zinc transport system substrate-binding protein